MSVYLVRHGGCLKVTKTGFVDLGSIKGNIGDQNYTLGSDVDLTKYRAVSVWCKRFSANFGTAVLSADRVAHRRDLGWASTSEIA